MLWLKCAKEFACFLMVVKGCGRKCGCFFPLLSGYQRKTGRAGVPPGAAKPLVQRWDTVVTIPQGATEAGTSSSKHRSMAVTSISSSSS